MQIKATAGYHPHTSDVAFSLIPIYLIHDNQKASVGMWKSKTRKVKRPVQGQRAGSHWVTNSILLKYLGNGGEESWSIYPFIHHSLMGLLPTNY